MITLALFAAWIFFRFAPKPTWRRRKAYVYVDDSAVRFSLLELT